MAEQRQARTATRPKDALGGVGLRVFTAGFDLQARREVLH
jgi:hypothetical protein